jgi:hypothetical protein
VGGAGIGRGDLRDVVLDSEENTDRITRRSALFGAAGGAFGGNARRRRHRPDGVVLATLEPIGLYSVLAALERLYQSPDSVVRHAAVKALARYSYKRTFVTLERALRDSEATVAARGDRSAGRLRFATLSIARSDLPPTQIPGSLAALRAISRIDVIEAAELSARSARSWRPRGRQARFNELRPGAPCGLVKSRARRTSGFATAESRDRPGVRRPHPGVSSRLSQGLGERAVEMRIAPDELMSGASPPAPRAGRSESVPRRPNRLSFKQTRSGKPRRAPDLRTADRTSELGIVTRSAPPR